jgi:hypothetical protein
MQPACTVFPSDLKSSVEPQCDVYALWHVCRSLDGPGINAGIRTVEFRSLSTWTFMVKNPSTSALPGRVCFFACPPVLDSKKVLLNTFISLCPRLEQLVVTPASVGEFSSAQMLLCESLGHKARINASIETQNSVRRSNLLRRAVFMYEAALRMTAHATIVKLLDRISRRSDEVYAIRTNGDISGVSDDGRRMITCAFAGLALCAMYQDNFARFGSYASLAVGWDDIGGIFALNAIRTIALLDSKFDMYIFITRTVLMPYLVCTGRRSIMTDELRFCTPAKYRTETLTSVMELVENFNGDVPLKNLRNLVDGGRVVERKCIVCGKAGGKLHHCSKCNAVYYCGKDCQRVDWAQHKLVCGAGSAELVWRRVV